jgi:LysR family transcriptional regulator, nitrogen assimilation regulatory protein
MEFRQLRYFVTIVEQGSLSKASLVLNIAQPALSTHVRNMELELGAMLLLRGAHGVRPTAAGKTLFEHAHAIMDRIELARREIADQQAEPSGEVRLGLPGTIGQVVSVPLILAARERYPKVKLCIAEAMSGFVLEWAKEGRVDLAMLYLGVDDRKLRSSPILTEELRLFCLKGYAGERPSGAVASYHDIARLPLVLPSASHGLRQLLDAEAEAHGVPLGGIIEVDAYNSIRELVQTGMGFAILPSIAITGKAHEAAFDSWSIGTPALSRTVHLVRPNDNLLGHTIAVIERLCRTTLAELVRSGHWASSKLVDPD